MNVQESLKSLSGYPIPRTFIANVLADLELDGEAKADSELRADRRYIEAKIAVYRYLSTAPNISQGGISYSLSSEDKQAFKTLANELSLKLGEDEDNGMFGYKGDSF